MPQERDPQARAGAIITAAGAATGALAGAAAAVGAAVEAAAAVDDALQARVLPLKSGVHRLGDADRERAGREAGCDRDQELGKRVAGVAVEQGRCVFPSLSCVWCA